MKKIILVSIFLLNFGCDVPETSYFNPQHKVPQGLVQELTVFTGDSNTFAIKNLPGWNIAFPGYTISDVMNQVQAINKFHPLILVVMIGSNDVIGNTFGDNDDAFRASYSSLVHEMKASCYNLICISILPTILEGTIPGRAGSYCYFDNEKIDRYNDIIKEICDDEGVFFFNNHHLFSFRPDFFMSDGVHLSRKGQDLFVWSLQVIGLKNY